MVRTPWEAHRGQGNYYGHQRGVLVGQAGFVCVSLPGIHPQDPCELWLPMDAIYPPPSPVCPLTEYQVAEAAALVRALHGWSVVRTLVVPTGVPDSKFVFGKGNFQELTGK